MNPNIKNALKSVLPKPAIRLSWNILHYLRNAPGKRLIENALGYLRDSPQGKLARRLKKKDYYYLSLSPLTEQNIVRVQEAAEVVFGREWNFQSDALRHEIVHIFETCINHLLNSHKTINYLEIGSCQGLSMSIIGQMLIAANGLGELVSIDPYFSEGYVEQNRNVPVNRTTHDNAHRLYNSLHLNVDHMESISSIALKRLISENRKFQLIYIDGSHEGMNPLRDLGLAFELVSEKGIIMLDDHTTYLDVKSIKDLCDRHLVKIVECWKIAAYTT